MLRTPIRFPSSFPRPAPRRAPAPPIPESTFAFPRLPFVPTSDIALVLALYSIRVLDYYAHHRAWPRFASPGCACGEAVLP